MPMPVLPEAAAPSGLPPVVPPPALLVPPPALLVHPPALPVVPPPAPPAVLDPHHHTYGENDEVQPDPTGPGKYHRFKIKPMVAFNFLERG